MEAKTEFKRKLVKLSADLLQVKYTNGDPGDMGNEIGISLGHYLDTEQDIDDFINGIRHGLSITKGTH